MLDLTVTCLPRTRAITDGIDGVGGTGRIDRIGGLISTADLKQEKRARCQ